MAGRTTTLVPRSAATLAFALLVGVSGLLGDPAAVTARAEPGSGPTGAAAWLSAASTFASFAPVSPLLRSLAGRQAVNTGSDGRLTVLLLGSDTRKGGLGRTDTIMIMSLKGNTINAASIPRDTARILNPYTATPNDTFKPRVNAILKKLRKGVSTNAQALEKFEYVIEQLLQIEIDYYALITFRGFEALVDEVDPVYVNINKTVKDKRFWDDPNKTKGVYFPAQGNYYLYALPYGPLCNGLFKNYTNPPSSTWCHRALPFVRSRKGPGNSDFVRARRQQDFIGATIRAVINRGSGQLGALVNKANGQAAAGALYTDIPFNSSSLELFNDLYYASLGNQVVFSPQTYSTHIPGTSAYQLNLSAVRSWAAANLK